MDLRCRHRCFAPSREPVCTTLTEVSMCSIALASATADSICPARELGDVEISNGTFDESKRTLGHGGGD